MSATAQILLAISRMAKGRQESKDVWASGTDFWHLTDAAADQTYEDIVKGADLTAVDASLALGSNWSYDPVKRWFALHETYAKALGYLAVGNVPAFSAFLKAETGARVPYETAECLHDAMALRLPAWQVFPKGTTPADTVTPVGTGMVAVGVLTGPSTWVEGALSGLSAMVAINMVGTQSVGAVLRCYNYVASSYKDITLSLVEAAQYTQTVLGRVAIASGVTAGDSSIQVASTTNFTAGEYVLVTEGSVAEVVQVTSLGTGPTRLVLSTPMVNAFTTSGKVTPMFSNVEYLSDGSGTGAVNVYAMPDKIIAL